MNIVILVSSDTFGHDLTLAAIEPPLAEIDTAGIGSGSKLIKSARSVIC